MCLIASIAFCYYYLYNLHQKEMDIKIHTMYALPDFCLGAFIALACHSKNRIYLFLKSRSPVFYSLIYVALIIFNTFKSYKIINADIIVQAVFNSVCYALILFDQTFNERRLFNLGGFRIINYLGKISYGLYIYHLLIISIIAQAISYFNFHSEVSGSLLQYIFSLIVTVAIAHLSFQYFEKPFLRIKINYSVI